MIVIFNKPIGRALRFVGNGVLSPFIRIHIGIRSVFSNSILNNTSKEKLIEEVLSLRSALILVQEQNIVFDALQRDYDLISNLSNINNSAISAIVSRAPVTDHDTVIISAGSNDGIAVGDLVFSDLHIGVGEIVEVFKNKATVRMYSFSGKMTHAVSLEPVLDVNLIGRGGGTFEITLPKNTELQIGAPIVLPRVDTVVVGVVNEKISNEKDSFVKYLASTPFNIHTIRFVSVEKSNE